MKMLRGIIACFVFLLPFLGISQKNTKVILDAATRLPVDYVYVSSDDKSLSLLSNKDGKLILVTDGKVKAYSFYKIGYIKRIIAVSELVRTDTIFLQQNVVDLESVSVTARLIDTIVKDKRFYVNDYLVLPNNDLILLTSKINIKGFEMLYFKKGRGITHVKKLREESGEHFFTDCFKNIHLLTNSFSRQLYFESDSSFNFLPKYTKSKFDSTLVNCALKLDSQVIVRYTLPPMQVEGGFMQNSWFLRYLKISKGSGSPFYTVVYDKRLMEMLQNEMADDHLIAASAQAKEAMHRLFYTKIAAPIYAPVFLKNDTVIIFNFNAGVIVALDKDGAILREVNITDHKNYVDHEVLFDEIRQQFYIKTKRSDKERLQRVSIYTGETSPEIKLHKVFAKNIQIQNGSIYYLAKERGWDDTSYLYQQN